MVFTKGEVIFAPKDCSNWNGGTLYYSFILLSFFLVVVGGRVDLNVINGSLDALGLDLSLKDSFQTLL